MIPEYDTAYYIERTTDKYGSVVSTTETSFGCLIDRDEQFRVAAGETYLFGRGIVFTSSDLGFEQGQHLKIDDTEYEIRRLAKLHVHGSFHHYELIYG